MGQPFSWPEPDWLSAITDPQLQSMARIRFFLALAAIYCSEKGNLQELSTTCGKMAGAVRTGRWRARPGPQLAIGIEEALGRHLFPRELFRPDLFAGQGEE